ncbi:hypothetical protein PFISCL1PPCAC_1622, partial [Pristionchus fissidentatus]
SGRSFPETVCTLLLISLISLLLHSLTQILGDFIVSNIALVGALFCYHFLAVHSYKLSRNCNLIFDEANLLSLTKSFEYELGFMDDCVTPAAGVEVKIEPPKPSSLWEALFFDDKAYKMNEFYRQMYGGEYERAMRLEAEERARRALSESKTPIIPSKMATSAAKSTVTSSISIPSPTPNEKQ